MPAKKPSSQKVKSKPKLKPIVTIKKPTKLPLLQREKQIQNSFFRKYGGLMEFETANGRIDLLTRDTIYEFKLYTQFKSCLGQLLAYALCVSGKKLVAVLFGIPESVSFSSPRCLKIKELFTKHGIEVIFLH